MDLNNLNLDYAILPCLFFSNPNNYRFYTRNYENYYLYIK
jgi:hypothetical protein